MWARNVVGNDRYVWYSSVLTGAGAGAPLEVVGPSAGGWPRLGEPDAPSVGSGRSETDGEMPRREGASLLSVRLRTCDGARLCPLRWIDDARDDGWDVLANGRRERRPSSMGELTTVEWLCLREAATRGPGGKKASLSSSELSLRSPEKPVSWLPKRRRASRVSPACPG